MLAVARRPDTGKSEPKSRPFVNRTGWVDSPVAISLLSLPPGGFFPFFDKCVFPQVIDDERFESRLIRGSVPLLAVGELLPGVSGRLGG